MELHLAVAKIRGTVLNMSTHLVARELAGVLAIVQPRCIVADVALQPQLLSALRDVPRDAHTDIRTTHVLWLNPVGDHDVAAVAVNASGVVSTRAAPLLCMVQRGFEALLHATFATHHLGPESVLGADSATAVCPPQWGAANAPRSQTKGVIFDFGPGTGSLAMSTRLAVGVMQATDVVTGAAPSVPSIAGGAPAGASTSVADMHALVTAAVRSVLGEVVDDAEQSILAAGVDSRVALQCHAAVEKALDSKLPVTLVFDYPTISAIVGYVSTRMLGDSDTPPLPQHLAAGEGPVAAVCQVGSVRSNLPVAGESISDIDSSQQLSPVPDSLSTVPFARWDVNVPPAFDSGSKPMAHFGGFVAKVELFDTQLFACASSEAILMDPQQRLLLELSVSPLAAARVSSSAGSVYVGSFFQEYAARTALEQHATLRGSSFSATGIASSVVSGRLSFTYGMNGPSLTVQTACSSSLVAAHLGRQCLAQRTSAFALAAGVNMLLDPLSTAMFSSAAMLAADGRCKALDARADGYVRAEAVGLLTMSRVAEAAFVVDRPACFFAGSAVNQDGRSTSLTGERAHSP